jgi:hypothetical protein
MYHNSQSVKSQFEDLTGTNSLNVVKEKKKKKKKKKKMDVRWNYFIVKVEGIDQKITNETCRLNESEECHSNLNEEMKSTSRNHQSRQH